MLTCLLPQNRRGGTMCCYCRSKPEKSKIKRNEWLKKERRSHLDYCQNMIKLTHLLHANLDNITARCVSQLLLILEMCYRIIRILYYYLLGTHLNIWLTTLWSWTVCNVFPTSAQLRLTQNFKINYSSDSKVFTTCLQSFNLYFRLLSLKSFYCFYFFYFQSRLCRNSLKFNLWDTVVPLQAFKTTDWGQSMSMKIKVTLHFVSSYQLS